MTRAHFHVAFMKGWCDFSSYVKQCLWSVNHGQFPLQMTQNSNHKKWLEILAGEDFPPKLWRTPTIAHRQRIEGNNREAERTSLSTAKATSSSQRPQTCTEAATNTTITLQAKPMKRGNAGRLPTLQKATRRWGKRLKFTVKFIFFDAAIGSKSYTICTMHVKNIFPMDSISL